MTDEQTPVKRFQPFEQIFVERKDGDPVLEVADLRIYLGIVTHKLHQARLYGGPNNYYLFEEMRKFAPGDLVVVTNAFRDGVPPETQATGVGYFLGQREEWAHTDEEWEEIIRNEGEQERPIEPAATYLQIGPVDACRWVQSRVVKALV